MMEMETQEKVNQDDQDIEHQWLRMKELVALTGVPKSTIIYYLGEGLLPEPYKTSPNMAYYDPVCIERLRFIQYMQSYHRLTIAEIKDLMQRIGEGGDYAVYSSLKDWIFGFDAAGGDYDREHFLEQTGLTENQLKELLQERLLLPLQEGSFNQQDVQMGYVLAQALSWGITVEDLVYYVELGDQWVDQDMALRERITHHLSLDAAVTLDMVKNGRISRTYIFERLFQLRVAAMKGIKDGKFAVKEV